LLKRKEYKTKQNIKLIHFTQTLKITHEIEKIYEISDYDYDDGNLQNSKTAYKMLI